MLLIEFHGLHFIFKGGNLEELHQSNIPTKLKVKAESTKDLLLIFSECVMVKFKKENDSYEMVVGWWCNACRWVSIVTYIMRLLMKTGRTKPSSKEKDPQKPSWMGATLLVINMPRSTGKFTRRNVRTLRYWSIIWQSLNRFGTRWGKRRRVSHVKSWTMCSINWLAHENSCAMEFCIQWPSLLHAMIRCVFLSPTLLSSHTEPCCSP